MTKTGRNDPCPCNSGEKYKRCCLNNPFISDRFTANLFQRIQTLANRIHDSSEAATDALEKRARSMIPGSDHREEVCAQILQYLDWLESQVRPLIARHSSIFWLCLDSRFPPGFDQQGDDLRRSAMSQMFNITKTLLFHKFGNTNIEPFT